MRVKSALKNSIYGMLAQLMFVLLCFGLQWVFVDILGKENLGLNGVYTNILSVLSLAELGVSTAIVYNLFQPLAEQDEKTIAALMRMFRKFYHIIAGVIGLLGILILPFVHRFTTNLDFSIQYMRIIFALFVIRTVASYLYSYKRSLLIAAQKGYMVTMIDVGGKAFSLAVSYIMLKLTSSFAIFLVVNIAIDVLVNLIISGIANRRYPYILQYRNERLSTEKQHRIWKDIKNVFAGRVSKVVLNSTDNLIISKFVDTIAVGLYSNYSLIITAISSIITNVLNMTQSSIGDMFVEKDNEKNYLVLRQMTFLVFIVGAFACASLFCLMTPFVTELWLGKEYELPLEIILICVVNFFVINLCGPLWSMVGVSGLFQEDKYISMSGAVLNLIVSLILVQYLGMFGVFLGTFISQMMQFLLKIRLFFKKFLFRAVGQYVIELLLYTAISWIEIGITYALCQQILLQSTLLSFVVHMLICLVVPNALNFALFFRTERFRSVWGLIKGVLAEYRQGRQKEEEKK